jgi:hypothetical protein
MRRRRIAAVALLVVLLLMVPLGAGLGRQAFDNDSPPANKSSSPRPNAPTGPKVVILDPMARSGGPGPGVSTVRDKSVWTPSGERIPLPDRQFGTVAEYGSGFAWLTQAGGGVRLNVAQRAIRLDAKPHEVVGVEPGPDGSVMVRTKAGPVIVTADAMQVTPDQPELKTDHMVASANAIWVDDGRRVRRSDTSDLTHQPFAGRDLGPWRTVVVGDPRSDRVVVTDAQGCHAVLNGSTGATVWQTCEWAVSAFSADGRLAVARTVKYGSYGIIDLTAGEL